MTELHGGRALLATSCTWSRTSRASSPPGTDALDVLRACFPAGTVSRRAQDPRDGDHRRAGAARAAASTPARWATSTFTGDLDMCIAIRTLVYARGTRAYRAAGAGIVADSDPGGASSEETLNKARGAARGASARGRADWSATVILMIDNYDSFTYNLVQYLGELGGGVEVVRNDAITVDDAGAKRAEGIVISPGPGTPNEAGRLGAVIRAFGGQVPILGVCLGHQCLGAGLRRHGRARAAAHARQDLADPPRRARPVRRPAEPVRGDPLPLADRARRRRCRDELELMAWTPTTARSWGCATASRRTWGVQFHPESILTGAGPQLLAATSSTLCGVKAERRA